jgi:hypothetical protein
MALDFPTSPSIGQLYPSPPVAGQPVYKWDGEKWAVTSSSGVIYAPFDAMAYSGLQINGGMEVSQENGAGTVLSTTGQAKYIVDGWRVGSIGPQVIGGTQGAGGPAGFVNQLQTNITTANGSPAAGDIVYIAQPIEGYRTIKLGWGAAGAQSIVIAFWVAAGRVGTYSGSIQNGAFNRSYVFTFTINSVSTWEYKTITVPGDVAGTWNKNNSAGINLSITLMAGTSFTTAAGSWVGGSFYGATGTINGVAATSDVFLITGVTVIPGNQGPTAAQSPNVMRPYDQELVTCKRYLQGLDGMTLSGFAPIPTLARHGVTFLPAMRTSPTIVAKNLLLFTTNTMNQNANPASSIAAGGSLGPNQATLDVTYSGATFGAGQGCVTAISAGGIMFDARL